MSVRLSSIVVLVEAVLSWLPTNPGRVSSQAFHFHPLASQLGLRCAKLRAQKMPVMGQGIVDIAKRRTT